MIVGGEITFSNNGKIVISVIGMRKDNNSK
jgi:hypothetical protein